MSGPIDGAAEEAAIRGRLSDLVEGRIFDDEPDDTEVAIDAVGKPQPYIVLSFGVPYAKPGAGRAFGDGEKDVPYILTFVVGAFAGTRAKVNATYAAIADRLVDFQPTGSSLPISIPFARNSSRAAVPDVRPRLVGKIAAMQTTINA